MLIQPASNEDLQSVYKSLTADMRGMQAEIDSLAHTISASSATTDGLRADVDVLTNVVHELKTAVVDFTSHIATSCSGHHPPSNTTPLTIRIRPRNALTPATVPATSKSLLPATASATARRPMQFRALAPHPGPMALNTLPRVREPTDNSAVASAGRTRSSSQQLPKAGLVIPDVPVILPDGTRRPRSESWRDIVEHWMSGTLNLSLHTALKE